MNARIASRRPAKPGRALLVALGVAAATLAGATEPASAYSLYKTDKCSPGQKWDVSRPIQVRLLSDSALDWMKLRVQQPIPPADWLRLLDDIAAVVELYNSVPGSGLRLEFDRNNPIIGDSNLEYPANDNFGDQTIVVGFTGQVAAGSGAAEAFTPGDLQDGCTRTRAHVMFRKSFKVGLGKFQTYNWVFGPPDTTDVNGRSFWSAEQPSVAGASSPLSFLGILTHEMGHALGLGHPHENYAIMAQAFRTWFRGADHVLRTRLLPDDIAGLRALYGDGSDADYLDVSVTNSWYKNGELRADCSAEETAVGGLERQLAQLQASLNGSQSAGSQGGELAALAGALIDAQDDLQSCLDAGAAGQTDNCKVSSRGDEWVDRSEGLAFCGVNESSGSAYPAVSSRVCPGQSMQLRYTLNNQSLSREVLARAEVWLSPTTRLDVRDPKALKSPDVREFTVGALDSRTIGQMFRMPADAQDGEAYQVFVRVVPTDPSTGADLWAEDADKWNNAIMLRSGVAASLAACI